VTAIGDFCRSGPPGKPAWPRRPGRGAIKWRLRRRNGAASTVSEHRRASHDRPLFRGGIHAAVYPVLGPGGDRFREQAFALGAFTGQFPRAADGFGLPACLGFGRLLISRAGLHFTEDAFALHLFLEGFQRLIDVVVPDHDNYDLKLSIDAPAMFQPNRVVRAPISWNIRTAHSSRARGSSRPEMRRGRPIIRSLQAFLRPWNCSLVRAGVVQPPDPLTLPARPTGFRP